MRDSQICSAIEGMQTLSFAYHGYPRTVEPHAYGVDSQGHEAIRAYQTDGSSESGEYRGWKLFHIADMRNLTVLTESFSAPRSGYKRGDKAMARIYCQL